jgi:hypothetical protein
MHGVATNLQEGLLGPRCWWGSLFCLSFGTDEYVGSATVSGQQFRPRPTAEIRSALYAHKLHTAYFRDLNKPEQFGFASM